MKIDDDWIWKNKDNLTPETAKFLLSVAVLGKLKVTEQTTRLLQERAGGHPPAGAGPRRPDWAERAAGPDP